MSWPIMHAKSQRMGFEYSAEFENLFHIPSIILGFYQDGISIVKIKQ